MVFTQEDVVLYTTLALHIVALGWLLKATIGSLWLYYKERYWADLVITMLFGGFFIERVSIVVSNLYLYPFYPPDMEATPMYALVIRLIAILILNIIFLVYDLSFFRYGGPE